MSNKAYTVLIVPERSSKVRRLIISHSVIFKGFALGALFVGLAGFMAVHYAWVVDQAGENKNLKSENVNLKAHLKKVQGEIARIDGTIERVSQFADKVRAITKLNDPERNLAIGPLSEDEDALADVLYAPGERIEFEDELADSKLALRYIDSKLDAVDADGKSEERSLRELHDFLSERPTLLSTTPSIRPTRSKLLTSTFGMRTDPYTNRRVMHKGIDIAADHGADVAAPADGRVIFAGHRGTGHGNTIVLDHGYGVQTHFAHLSAFKVEVGQVVRRGQIVGAVGNTGRSTGPHLHYEVRFGGIPQDPERFILN